MGRQDRFTVAAGKSRRRRAEKERRGSNVTRREKSREREEGQGGNRASRPGSGTHLKEGVKRKEVSVTWFER